MPNGESGDWKVFDYTVTEEQAKFENMRAAFSFSGRFIKPGIYKVLKRNGTTIMSNTPAEIADHREFIWKASQGGHILINGLGLGVALSKILKSEKVLSVTVIEKSADVIALCADTYTSDPRVTIHHADAFTWKPPKNMRYSAVWHDIWDYICADNLTEMHKLHRRYGRKSDWQGSWCRYQCERLK